MASLPTAPGDSCTCSYAIKCSQDLLHDKSSRMLQQSHIEVRCN